MGRVVATIRRLLRLLNDDPICSANFVEHPFGKSLNVNCIKITAGAAKATGHRMATDADTAPDPVSL
jgi:hypothetical protein